MAPVMFSGFDAALKLGLGVFYFLVETGLFIALILIYSSTMNDYNILDLDALQFYVDNQCSNGPLQASYELIQKDLKHEYRVLSTGLSFVIIGLFFHILNLIWFYRYDLRNYFCCVSKAEIARM
jgi:hypothetical protein